MTVIRHPMGASGPDSNFAFGCLILLGSALIMAACLLLIWWWGYCCGAAATRHAFETVAQTATRSTP